MDHQFTEMDIWLIEKERSRKSLRAIAFLLDVSVKELTLFMKSHFPGESSEAAVSSDRADAEKPSMQNITGRQLRNLRNRRGETFRETRERSSDISALGQLSKSMDPHRPSTESSEGRPTCIQKLADGLPPYEFYSHFNDLVNHDAEGIVRRSVAAMSKPQNQSNINSKAIL